jgi:hypothetical protein
MISEIVHTNEWLKLGRMMQENIQAKSKTEDNDSKYVTNGQKAYTEYICSKYGANWLYKVKNTVDDRAFLRNMRQIMHKDFEERCVQHEQQEELQQQQERIDFIEDLNHFIQEEEKMERQLRDRVICPQAFRQWQYDHADEYERFSHLL